MNNPTPRPGPVAQAQVGMPVIDADGETIGTVETMKMGDPQAVTAEGQQPTPSSWWEALVDTFLSGEPDVPRQRAEQLLRTGYLKIDSARPFARDRYVSADHVAAVDGGTVRLAVSKGQLTRER